MKSRFALCILSLAFLVNASVTAKVVTADNARNIAKSFLSSKGLPDKDLQLYHSSDEPAVFRAPSIDFEAPAYHIFSDTGKNEIIVVAGDDIARPILGYSLNYKSDENGQIPPAMKEWLSEMERQISIARKSGAGQDSEIAKLWGAPSSGAVVKQLNTAKWGQNYPFNLQCPISDGERCITGCVATSYAILMKYYRYPSGAIGYTQAYVTPKLGVSVPSRVLSAAYDWDSMPLDYSENYNTDQIMEVAKLMADIGAVLRADYTPRETAAHYEGGYMFKHFGYYLGPKTYKSDYSAQEWYSMMKEQLDNNRPILYNAQIEDGSAAHSFIIDGYTDNDYFCINWGWAGSCDGVYALDAMIPYDNPYYTFTGSQCAYFDFKSASGLPVVAQVNDSIECPSLEAAVAMVPTDGIPAKITMLDNCDIEELYTRNNQSIVLDLNGCKIGVVNYGIYNYGDLIIADSKINGCMVFKKGTSAILNNYGKMTVYGGQFVNQTGKADDENYYRRCIWTESGSSTCIKGGNFKSFSSAICTNGSLTIDGGEFDCNGNDAVITNYNVQDTVTINGGNFNNLSYAADGSNYRRTVWSCEGSVTHITGGVFTCRYQTITTNGDCIIDNGRFECIGNSAVLNNYSKNGKMTINGGVFVNSLGIKEQQDYRRSLYSAAETNVQIKGGKFSSPNQVITTVGKLVITNATIENTGDGIGVLAGSGSVVTINNCKLKANTILANNNNSVLKCYGGLYSKIVAKTYLGSGCNCVMNDDDATFTDYHYKVINTTGIDNVIKSADTQDLHYDLNGMSVPDNTPGIHIIRRADGKTMKVLYR